MRTVRSRIKGLTRTEEQCIEQNLDYDFYNAEWIIKDVCYNNDGSEYFELVNSQKPYLHNLARIKAALSSFARIKIAHVALKNLKKVVRIHTDCVVFSEPFNYKGIVRFKIRAPPEKERERVFFQFLGFFETEPVIFVALRQMKIKYHGFEFVFRLSFRKLHFQI